VQGGDDFVEGVDEVFGAEGDEEGDGGEDGDGEGGVERYFVVGGWGVVLVVGLHE
jgi:hypothetical protein